MIAILNRDITINKYAGEYIECREDEFTCKDGSCISMNKECDKRFDCEDKSDEDKSYCKSMAMWCTLNHYKPVLFLN